MRADIRGVSRAWWVGGCVLLALAAAAAGPASGQADSAEIDVTLEVLPSVSLRNDCQNPAGLALDADFVGAVAPAVTDTGAGACRFEFSGTAGARLFLRQRDGTGTAMVGESGGAENTLRGFVNPMNDATIVDANTAVVVGYYGRIYRMTDGVNWNQEWLPGFASFILRGVDMVDATTGWAVADGGHIFKRTAGGWAAQTSPTTESLNQVVAVSSTVAYAVGDAGTVVRTLDGTNWTELPKPFGTNLDLYAAAATAANQLIVGGNGSFLARTNNANNVPASGVSWSTPANSVPGSTRIRSIEALTFNSMWLQGTGNTYYSANFGGIGGWSVRGELAVGFDGAAASASEYTVVGSAGEIVHTTDGGANWTNLTSPSLGRTLGLARLGDTIVAATDGTGAYHSTDGGETWTTITSDRPPLAGVAAAGRTRAWFVGSHGTILTTTDGASVSAQNSNTTAHLRNIAWLGRAAAAGGELLIAVGDAGTVLRSTNGGGAWTAIPSGTTADLYSVSSADGQRVYAVGEAGAAIVSSDSGLSWQSVTTGTSNNLWAVTTGESADRAWASGTKGKVVYTTDGGTSWTSSPPVGSSHLTGLYAANDSTVYAGTGAGNHYRTSDGGITWSLATSPGNSQVQAIDGFGAGFVVSGAEASSSGLLSWDGLATSTSSPQVDTYVTDMAVFDAVGTYEVTQRGGIFRHTYAQPIADYAAGRWGTGSELFGVCLQSVGPDTQAVWTVQSGGNPAVCEPIDADSWRAVPAAWSEVAATDDVADTGEIELVWGMQAVPTTMSATYRAAVIVEVLSADV